MKDTLSRIRNRIENSTSIREEAREEILGLLSELDTEIEGVPREEGEEAVRSALGLTELSAYESARSDQGRESPLKEQTFGAWETSIQELESSHPRIAEVIAKISHVLSRMGI